jgi:hypothetical protein
MLARANAIAEHSMDPSPSRSLSVESTPACSSQTRQELHSCSNWFPRIRSHSRGISVEIGAERAAHRRGDHAHVLSGLVGLVPRDVSPSVVHKPPACRHGIRGMSDRQTRSR